jgi:transposase-like protein
MLTLAIESVKQAYKEFKSFCIDDFEGDYRFAAKQALKDIIEKRMSNTVDAYLEDLRVRDISDRRNGYYSRHLLTELGDIELQVPRTRTFSPIGIIRQFARRTVQVERMILLCFVLGLSTRKVGTALLPILGEPVSASTVSRIAKELDEQVAAYHRRKLKDQYEVLILDGIVMKRKTGVGAQKRTVLVALGIRPDGKKEIIDFRQASSESQSSWEGFLNNLYKRGLTGEKLKLITIDGGKGLKAAIPLVYGNTPIQRCWAHKTRNVLNYLKRTDQPKAKKDLQKISHAKNIIKARQAAKQFVDKWHSQYPRAANCLKKDLPELLTFLTISSKLKPTELRTTNAIERRFKEVRRRTRPMGTFSDRTSIDRIMFSVFAHENLKEKTAAPFLMTQNS